MSQLPRPISSGSSSISRETSSVTSGSLTGTKNKIAKIKSSSLASTNTSIEADSSEKFLVGDTVYVGGTKLGKVAFIGEAKFAPGEWVGVELQEPVGKNDGSVGGVSYFKCKPMHGVFSRASRLTREKNAETSSTPVPERRKISSRLPTSISPANSTKEINKSRSVSPAGSVSSIASSAMSSQVKLGDRVIVSSQTAGTKTGTLRYLGPTDFAAGDWAGVELDAAIGKNDGSVGDKKYFECKPKFGLFAPLHKVTKSPSNKMKKLSVTNAASPGRLYRQRSDLSDISMTSNASIRTSTGLYSTPPKAKKISSIVAPERLRNAVKEKEAKIEQLLKERDMERKEIAKAANQTEDAERSLDLLRESYMAYKAQSTQQVLGLVNDINLLQDDKKVLRNELDDEKRKVEDLQFQLEENELMRGETDTAGGVEKQELSKQIDELKTKLIQEEADHTLQKESCARLQKEIETETSHKDKFKEEVDDITLALESERQKSKDEKEKLQILYKDIKLELEKKSRELSYQKEEYSNKVFEYEEQISGLSAEIESNRTELKAAKDTLTAEQKQVLSYTENFKNQNEKFLEQISTLEGKISSNDDEIIKLNHKIEVTEKSYQQTLETLNTKNDEIVTKTQECHELGTQLNQLKKDFSDQTENLQRIQEELDTSMKDVAEKKGVLQDNKDQVSQLEKIIASKEKALEDANIQSEKVKSNFENIILKKTEEIAQSSAKLSEVTSTADEVLKEKEELQKRCSELQKNVETKEKGLENANEINNNLEKEIELLQKSSEKKSDEVKRLSGTISEKDNELEELRANTSSLSSQLQQLNSVISKGEDDMKVSEAEMKLKFAKEISDLEDKLKKADTAKEKTEKSKEDAIQSLNSKIKNLSEDNNEVQQKLKSNIAKLESKCDALEKEKENLKENSAATMKDSSLENQKLKQNNSELETKLSEITNDCTDKERKIGDLLEKVKLIESLECSLKCAQEEKHTEKQKNSDLEIQCNSLSDKIKDLEKERIGLNNTISDLRTSTSDSDAQLQSTTQEILVKNNEICSLKSNLSDKKLEVDTLEARLANSQAEAREEIKKQNEIQIATLSQHEKEKKSLEHDIKLASERYTKMKESLEKSLEDSKLELQEELNTALEEVTERESELFNLKIETAKSQSEIDTLKREVKSAIEDKLDMEERLECLKRNHTDEMGDLVDVVNDLKSKEEELALVNEQLDTKKTEFEKLKRDATRKETDLMNEIKNEKLVASKETEVITRSLSEAQSQIEFLKESNSSLMVEHDLKVEKIRKEREVELSSFHSELDNKDAVLEKLQEELEQTKEELEFNKEELAAKIEELEDLSTDLEVKEAGFNNSFKEVKDNHKDEIEVLISKVEEANSTIGTLHETIAVSKASHDTKVDELLSNHKSQTNNLQDSLSEKEQIILDLNAKISNVEGKLSVTLSSMDDETKVAETRIEKMQQENEELRIRKGESDAMVRSLQTDCDSMNHQNEVLSIKIVEKEEHIRQVTTQVESMKVSFEKTQRELSERMERTSQDTQSMADLQKEIEIERTRVDEMQLFLAEVEGERDTLKEATKDYNALKEQHGEMEERETMLVRNIEDLKQKHEFATEEFDAERAELNDVVQKCKTLLQDKLEEFKVQQSKFEQLEEENHQLNNYKRQVLLLEQEKRNWESSRPSATFIKELSPAKSMDEDTDSLRSQVEFLNSVIVDMQRKNDDLKSKFEHLESAVGVLDDFGVDTQDMMLLNGIDKKKPAPRLFCDICDEFDLHDTEDCPTQAMPDIEEDLESKHTKSHGARGAVREYCTNCEIFGHSTENCDEEQTF